METFLIRDSHKVLTAAERQALLNAADLQAWQWTGYGFIAIAFGFALWALYLLRARRLRDAAIKTNVARSICRHEAAENRRTVSSNRSVSA